jgi:hypothetical protein
VDDAAAHGVNLRLHLGVRLPNIVADDLDLLAVQAGLAAHHRARALRARMGSGARGG